MTELEQLTQEAKRGDPTAQRKLGWKYHKGIDVTWPGSMSTDTACRRITRRLSGCS